MYLPDGSPSRVTWVTALARYLAPAALATLHSIGCGELVMDGPGEASNFDPGGRDGDGAAAANTDADGCYVPDPRPIPQRDDCAATAQACDARQGCVFT